MEIHRYRAKLGHHLAVCDPKIMLSVTSLVPLPCLTLPSHMALSSSHSPSHGSLLDTSRNIHHLGRRCIEPRSGMGTGVCRCVCLRERKRWELAKMRGNVANSVPTQPIQPSGDGKMAGASPASLPMGTCSSRSRALTWCLPATVHKCID